MPGQKSFARSLSLRALRRLGGILLTLLIIAYITLFGLTMAERGREGRPAEPLSAAGQAAVQTFNYVVFHPPTHFWYRQEIPSFSLILDIFSRSAVLLLVSLGLATAVGVPLGIGAALARRRVGAPLVLLLSILGVSTPSFLLAMLLWVVNIQAHRTLGVTALPAAGFGWDAHMVMPALVLAMRPLAQIAQVTYVSMSDVLGQDYIRTARAKGLSWRIVRDRHALRNVLIPILNTVGTSLRFSLSSLPVVEVFFHWPGVGLALWQAIGVGDASLVTDLIVSLGFLFLMLNLLLEFLFPILDPRLRGLGQAEQRTARRGWRERWAGFVDSWAGWWEALRVWIPFPGFWQARPKLPPLPTLKDKGGMEVPGTTRLGRVGLLLRAVFLNPALLVGTALVVGLIILAACGSQMSSADPYEVHGVMMIEGEVGAPPYPPSAMFPWGTDYIGRDVQALVLAGARQTLTLALFGMIARVLLGTVLGLLAGWWRHSWFDRLVTGAVGVWAAFPATLFAMLLIQALGIKQGMWVFVAALALVGWGEVAQFVRSQVIGIRPELYIQAARSMGSRARQILVRHVLPHLVPPLLVLAALEMGGILMLLAELGFLDIFLGGGFKVELMGETITAFSDVPEWGALLANIRAWWRSYPWMAWYPGVGFFLAIVAFNLFGEGLRRFLNEGRVSLSRLVNRYTVVAAAVVALVLWWVLQTAAPLGVYQPQAMQFDAQRAMEDIRVLSSPEFQGRETGMPGADRAADYIAGRMREIGLFPAGQKDTYFYTMAAPRLHMEETPRLEILDEQGNVAESLVYREDFADYALGSQMRGYESLSFTYGGGEGAIVGLTTGPYPGGPEHDPYHLGGLGLYDKVIVVREAELARTNFTVAAGALIVTDDPLDLQRRFLYRSEAWKPPMAVMYVSQEVGDRLLATAGSSLAELERMGRELGVGQVALSGTGVRVRLSIPLTEDVEDEYCHVIGFIPGSGAAMGPKGRALDNQVILVSAYYDGLGVGPDGTLYPGANDNASSVALMLEMARVLQEGPFQPKKTVVFAAWAGGERGEGLSVSNIMSAKVGFSSLTVEAVIELSGVGAGSGREIYLRHDSSSRLLQLFQAAAGRVGASSTTRGRGPHYEWEARTGFGGRSALNIAVSWDGSDQAAHTPADTFEAIDPEKLREVGRTTLLALTVLSREVNY